MRLGMRKKQNKIKQNLESYLGFSKIKSWWAKMA